MKEKVTIQFEIPISAFHTACFYMKSELPDEVKTKLLEKPCVVDTDKFEDQKEIMEITFACLAIGSVDK